MFFKYLNKICRFQRIQFIHNYIFKMDKAYLRSFNESEQFQLTFQYVNESLKVNRQFNFNRNITETVETFLSRVTTNVDKIVSKKAKKKKENNEAIVSEVKATLTVNGNDVPNDVICKDILRFENDIILSVLDKRYKIIINSPWVDSIALPNSVLANFPAYPSKCEAVFTDKNLSDFIWYKSVDKKQWTEIGRGYIYLPKNEDIDNYLKLQCTPKNEQLEGPTIEVVTENTVQASPGECPFDFRHQFTKNRAVGKEFRVVTYNILADLYCDSDYTREVLHPYCPPYALSIDYRKLLILKEIIGYNADIICLQEVDRSVFKHDIKPALEHLGLDGVLSLKGEEVAEGLAFFYNRDRFRHVSTDKIVYAQHVNKDPLFADIWEKIAVNSQLAERILARSTTLQVNVVESVEHDETLVIANTHLYFHPDADHIRLLHGCVAIRYLENFVKKLKAEGKNRVSLVFCGDFNSVPECGIYKLFTSGKVPKDFIDYQSNKEEQIENIEMTQNFQLDSACGTPEYTNFTAGFAACLDYIFYEKSNLGVTQVVPLPSKEELIRHTALPSVVFPSDHIALVSDLKWL